jgi:hypothetical protein
VRLRIVKVTQRPDLARRQSLVIEQNSCCDERACETAAAGFVGSGDKTPAERPIETKQLPRRRWPLRCGLFLRGGRSF